MCAFQYVFMGNVFMGNVFVGSKRRILRRLMSRYPPIWQVATREVQMLSHSDSSL